MPRMTFRRSIASRSPAPFTNNNLNYTLTLEANFYCSYFYGALCSGDDAHPSNYNNFGDGSAFANFLNTPTLPG